MMKRILCALLSVVLLVGMIPGVAAGETAEISTDTGTATVQGNDSLGNLLSDSIAREQEENEAEQDDYSGSYVITNLTFEGNVATVEYKLLEEATVMVAVYSEDGYQLLNSATGTASPDRTYALVTLEGEMPEYFEAAAYLLDQYDMSPLCAAYKTPMYTKAMQELLESDIHDYDPALVYNLDENEQTNFAVFQEDVRIIESTDGFNTLISADEENDIYSFGNTDNKFTTLEAGNVVAYSNEETELLLFKIATIEFDGADAHITGGELQIEEVFDCMKLETAGDSNQLEVDPESCGEGVTFLGYEEDAGPATRAWDDDVNFQKRVKFSLEKDFTKSDNVDATISGSVTLGLDAGLDYYISTRRVYLKLEVTASAKLELGFEGALMKDAPTKLAKIPLPSPIPSIRFEVTPSLAIKFTGSMQYSGEAKFSFGISYCSKNGFQMIGEPPEFSHELNFEGKLFIGLMASASTVVVHKHIGEVGVTYMRGVEFTAKAMGRAVEGDPGPTATKIHQCEWCVGIRADWVHEASMWLTVLKYLKVDYTFMSKRALLGRFHVQIKPDFSGLQHGTCPNYKYRVTVQVRDRAGYPREEVPVYVDGQKIGYTGKNGTVYKHLEEGNYTFLTHIDGEDIELEREIYHPTKVTLTNDPETLNRLAMWTYMQIKDLSVKREDLYKSGTLSTGVTWKLFRSGKMIVEGDGAIPDYTSSDGTPWYLYSSQIKQLQIMDGVTGVGEYAFGNCVNLQTLILPNELTYLGEYAFSGCSALKEIRMPVDLRVHGFASSVGTTYQGAFQGCTNVEKIQYMPGTTGKMVDRNSSYYDSNAYTYSLEYICRNSLKTVLFDEGVTHIGSYAYYHDNADNSQLENVLLPESLETIGKYAFFNSKKLKLLDIPYGVSYISQYAFYNSGIEDVYLSENLTGVGEYAFALCTNLESLVIPDHMGSTLGEYAFYGCTGLKSVTLPVDYRVYNFVSTMGVTYAGAFSGCSNVESITYTYGKTGKMLDRQGSNRASHYYQASLEYTCRGSLKSVFFDDGITHIGGYAFYQADTPAAVLEEVQLPATLESIGEYAFYGTGKLKNMELGDSLEWIGDYAFYGSGLEKISFPDSLSGIGEYSFGNCLGLTRLEIPDHMGNSLGEHAFYGCTGLKSVTLPVDYRISSFSSQHGTIYGGAFSGCSNVEAIHYTYGQSGKMVDRQDNNRANHYYQASLEHICGASLKKVTFEEGITSIGDFAYYQNVSDSGIFEITLPKTLLRIGDCAFSGVSTLKTIELHESVSGIGANAFCYSGLEGIRFPDSLTDIAEGCFQGCTGLTSLVIPDQMANSLGENAFRDCTGLLAVTLPADYRISSFSSQHGTIYGGAFSGCSNVKSITYTPGVAGKMLDRQENNRENNCYTHSLEYACSGSLESVTFREGVNHVGSLAFMGCSVLQHVQFEGSAPSFGENAFSGVVAKAYYPNGDSTWTADQLQSYGGTLTWQGYDKPETMSMSASASTGKPATRAIYNGSDAGQALEDRVIHTASAEGLVPGEQYAIFVVKETDVKDILAADNLLAVGQAEADENGMAGFDYIQREAADTFYVFATGASNQSLEEAQILFPRMRSSEEAQTIQPVVIYQGEELTEEVDYILLGQVDYTAAGTYTCYARGVRAYTGLVKCVYTVVENLGTAVEMTVSTAPDKTSYKIGEALDLTGMTLQLNYDSGASITVTGEETLTQPPDMTEVGMKTLTFALDGAQTTFTLYVHDTTQVMADSATYPESSHPYENNANETKSFCFPGAEYLVLTFSQESATEYNYDYISVYDGAGNQLLHRAGTLSGLSLTVPGDSFTICLTSDGGVQYYGYAFSSIVCHMPESEDGLYHPAQVVAGIAPTCTEGGKSEGSICRICGMTLTAQEMLPANGHSFANGACTVCGAEDPTPPVSFKGIKTTASIGLEEVIFIRATVAFTNSAGSANTDVLTKNEILANGRVLFWRDSNMPANWDEALVGTEDENSGLSDAGVYAGLQEYHAISHGIEAKQYTDKVYFRTYIVVDGVEHYGDIYEYSVVTYAQNQLKKTTTAQNEPLKGLLAAMLNYGAIAQTWFGYRTETPANSSLASFVEQGLLDSQHLTVNWTEDMMNIRDAVPAQMAGSFTGNGVSRTNRTLNLAGAIYARIVFGLNVTGGVATKPAEGTTVTLYFWSEKDYDKLAAAGTALSPDNASYTKEGVLDYTDTYGYEYLGDSNGVAAKNMSQALYVACVFTQPDGMQYTSGIEVYSAHVYAQSQLSKMNAPMPLKNLLKAMIVYGESAKAYFG